MEWNKKSDGAWENLNAKNPLVVGPLDEYNTMKSEKNKQTNKQKQKKYLSRFYRENMCLTCSIKN